MQTSNSNSVLSATILCLILCRISALAPSPAPISGIEPPSAPEPSGASAPVTSDCTTALFNMTDCLDYVTEGSNATAPNAKCCPEVAGLVDSNPICLCELLGNSSMTESFEIDVSRALKLPTICRITTPPVSTCAAFGYPIPGPSSSQIFPPGAHSPGGLASSPAAGSGNGNGAPNILNSAQSLFLGLALSLIITFF